MIHTNIKIYCAECEQETSNNNQASLSISKQQPTPNCKLDAILTVLDSMKTTVESTKSGVDEINAVNKIFREDTAAVKKPLYSHIAAGVNGVESVTNYKQQSSVNEPKRIKINKGLSAPKSAMKSRTLTAGTGGDVNSVLGSPVKIPVDARRVDGKQETNTKSKSTLNNAIYVSRLKPSVNQMRENQFIDDVQRNIASNPKEFWKYANHRQDLELSRSNEIRKQIRWHID